MKDAMRGRVGVAKRPLLAESGRSKILLRASTAIAQQARPAMLRQKLSMTISEADTTTPRLADTCDADGARSHAGSF